MITLSLNTSAFFLSVPFLSPFLPSFFLPVARFSLSEAITRMGSITASHLAAIAGSPPPLSNGYCLCKVKAGSPHTALL